MPLRPKAFQALAYLLIHRDRVVSKRELCDQIWLGRLISDATVESTLAAVRRAIGDEGRAQHSIQTRHGLGYRFIAPVQESSDSPPNVAAVALLLPGAASGMPTALGLCLGGEASRDGGPPARWNAR